MLYPSLIPRAAFPVPLLVLNFGLRLAIPIELGLVKLKVLLLTFLTFGVPGGDGFSFLLVALRLSALLLFFASSVSLFVVFVFVFAFLFGEFVSLCEVVVFVVLLLLLVILSGPVGSGGELESLGEMEGEFVLFCLTLVLYGAITGLALCHWSVSVCLLITAILIPLRGVPSLEISLCSENSSGFSSTLRILAMHNNLC